MKLVALRLALLLGAAASTAALLANASGSAFSLALSSQLSALYFIPVNLACLWLLRVAARKRGGGLRQLAGYRRNRLGLDALQGLLWSFVLFVPFIAAVMVALLVLFGASDLAAAFETVFAPVPASRLEFAPWFTLTTALLTALLFPLTNAPAEELVYRGEAQGGLFAAGRTSWLAVGLPAAVFGLQHLLLAPSSAGMLVYGLAFFAWGLAAGLIYRRQERLVPLIVAHFVTNAMFAVVPLAIFLAGPPGG